MDQFERGVVLTLGKFTSVREPGLNILIPYIQTMRRADMRVIVVTVPPQDVITQDNVSVRVSAVAYYSIVDAKKALIDVQDFQDAILQLAQVTLRACIGKHGLDAVLSRQDELNAALGVAIDARSKSWGVKISHVEINNVDLNENMIRAMAQEAEAERGRRARIVTAQGEFEAAQKLSDAADLLSRNPAAMTLRTLATLKEIGIDNNTTIIFPLSQELMMGSAAQQGAGAQGFALANAAASAASVKHPSVAAAPSVPLADPAPAAT